MGGRLRPWDPASQRVRDELRTILLEQQSHVIQATQTRREILEETRALEQRIARFLEGDG